MTQLLTKNNKLFLETKGIFQDKEWLSLCKMMNELYYFIPERWDLKQSRLMKLIAAIPYLAGCKNPERVAVTHLSITILAASPAGKKTFLHGFSDNADLMERLERISHFPGGDKMIIDRGMKLLALIMVNDHILDAEEDRKKGKYNPVNSGIWDAEKMKNDLIDELTWVDCPGMDEIISIHEAEKAFWVHQDGTLPPI